MNILVGITGSIAAYKANTLIREFVKKGHNVAVTATDAGLAFTSELTLSTITTDGVFTDLMDPGEDQPVHINLARWADIFVIAPCSLNTIGKMAAGIADNLLLATFFAFRKKIVIAPAMNDLMYGNEINKRNIRTLKDQGVIEIPPRWGDLASYDAGKGPMAQTEVIVKETLKADQYSSALSGRSILITAGGTAEPIDPVRVISNLSTGTMGHEIALACYRQGAQVSLVTSVPRSVPSDIELIQASSTEDYLKAVRDRIGHSDVFISAAAVSDFIPEYSKKKIKKKDTKSSLSLKKNTDILDWAIKNRKAKQIIVGFAAETELSEENISRKQKSKPVDILFANLISDTTGFGDKAVTGTLISGKRRITMEKISKEKAASLLCDLLHDK